MCVCVPVLRAAEEHHEEDGAFADRRDQGGAGPVLYCEGDLIAGNEHERPDPKHHNELARSFDFPLAHTGQLKAGLNVG